MWKVPVQRLVLLAVLALLLPVPSLAQSDGQQSKKDKSTDGTAAQAEGDEEEVRSNHSRYLKKIRPGSFIRRQEEGQVIPDMRSEYELRRDAELRRHFARLAQIDVIIGMAEKIEDASLLARAEALRRRENQRYRLAMERLRKIVTTLTVRGETP